MPDQWFSMDTKEEIFQKLHKVAKNKKGDDRMYYVEMAKLEAIIDVRDTMLMLLGLANMKELPPLLQVLMDIGSSALIMSGLAKVEDIKDGDGSNPAS